MAAPDLLESRELLRGLGQTVVCTDLRGRICYLSQEWELLTGYTVEESLGLQLEAVLGAEELRELSDAFAGVVSGDAATSRLELHTVHRDRTRRTANAVVHARRDAEGSLVGAMATLADVTAEREAEVTVRHSQKLESVGRLAAGIAHEINTPIQFIGDNLYFLSESFERVTALLDRYRSILSDEAGEMSWVQRQDALRTAEDDADMEFALVEVPEAVDSALTGVKRVASIVRAMKVFGHPDQTEGQSVDVNEIIRDALIIARNETKYVAEVEARYSDLPAVVGHPGDLGQVFLNLLVNAADAVRESLTSSGDLGRIVVRTLHDDERIMVAVTDSGTGIPPEVAARAFEPFYTTKEVGRDTGQGLSLARAIVDRHGGTLAFEPASGGGTTFVVTLPIGGVSE